MQHALAINKNLVSSSLCCGDGFKLAFESNKVVVFRFGLLIGKGYHIEGLFYFSLSYFNNSVINILLTYVMMMSIICCLSFMTF
jgi:hypothetical protein